MKNSDIIKTYRGLSHLIEPANPDGSPAKPYSFSGPVSYSIVKNLKRVKRAVEEFDETKQNIIKGLMKEGETSFPSTDERFDQFNAELIKVLDAEGDYTPIKIKQADLDVAKNAIQPTALLALDPILIDEDDITPDASTPSGV